MLTTSPVLALFDPTLDTILSADALSYGLGAVLLQRQPDGEQKPVSRYTITTEQRYAQIEKDFRTIWLVSSFISTDHKPLVLIFSTKRLEELLLRVQ
jgi:hypothetical protein